MQWAGGRYANAGANGKALAASSIVMTCLVTLANFLITCLPKPHNITSIFQLLASYLKMQES